MNVVSVVQENIAKSTTLVLDTVSVKNKAAVIMPLFNTYY